MTTTTSSTKTKEKIIEEQIQKWQQSRERRKKKEIPHPTITISRQMGSGGGTLGRKLAKSLGLDLFDGEIIHEVSESVKMSEKVVASLDERMRNSLENWIQILKTTKYLWPDTYRSHLAKVIGAIGEHGNAVIIGRGAHHLLPAEEILRIRFVAPLKYRIANVANDRQLSPEEASHLITKTEADRRTYIEQHFHVNIDDPTYYDLTINTEYINEASILKMVESALKFKKLPRRRRFDANNRV